MVDYIAGMKFSAFFLLARGAVVKQAEALNGLKAVAKRYFGLMPIQPFLTISPGLNLHIHLPLVPSTSSATRSQLGWCPMPTK